MLFDQRVLENKRFYLCVGNNDVEIADLAHKNGCFGVCRPIFLEVRPHPTAKILCLTYIEYSTLTVLVQIDARPSGQILKFLLYKFRYR